MKFFEFKQNNSGGHFDQDDQLTNRVIIEAEDANEASQIAESLGMYWNGVDCGMDCECCGDRWYQPWSDDGITFPYEYGTFTEDQATKIAEKYQADLKKVAKKKIYGNNTHYVVFKTVESYAQYISDDYGWLDPDCYIYYKAGRKVSITGERVKKVKRN
jgi:hypothetical protein